MKKFIVLFSLVFSGYSFGHGFYEDSSFHENSNFSQKCIPKAIQIKILKLKNNLISKYKDVYKAIEPPFEKRMEKHFATLSHIIDISITNSVIIATCEKDKTIEDCNNEDWDQQLVCLTVNKQKCNKKRGHWIYGEDYQGCFFKKTVQ